MSQKAMSEKAMPHKAMSHKAMRHEAIPLAFSYLWTLIRGRAAPPSSAKPMDVTRERDPQPPRLMPF